jgi:hypothetical protein
MKTLYSYLLLAVLLIFSSCEKPDEPIPVDEPTPLQKLASHKVHMVFYHYTEGHLVEDIKYSWSYEAYDQAGLLTQKQYRNNNTSPFIADNTLFTENNTYEAGFIKEKEILRSDHPSYKTYQRYTIENNRIKSYDLFAGNNSLIHKYWFDYKNGSEKPSTLYYSEYPFEAEPSTYEYTYDAKGNKIKEVITLKKNMITNATAFHWEYDAHNNITKETFINRWGEPKVKTMTYKYDSKGSVTEMVYNLNDHSKTLHKYVYHYDEKGFLQKEDVFVADNYSQGEYKLRGHKIHTYTFHN